MMPFDRPDSAEREPRDRLMEAAVHRREHDAERDDDAPFAGGKRAQIAPRPTPQRETTAALAGIGHPDAAIRKEWN